jgi:hypothetical protein
MPLCSFGHILYGRMKWRRNTTTNSENKKWRKPAGNIWHYGDLPGAPGRKCTVGPWLSGQPIDLRLTTDAAYQPTPLESSTAE